MYRGAQHDSVSLTRCRECSRRWPTWSLAHRCSCGALVDELDLWALEDVERSAGPAARYRALIGGAQIRNPLSRRPLRVHPLNGTRYSSCTLLFETGENGGSGSWLQRAFDLMRARGMCELSHSLISSHPLADAWQRAADVSELKVPLVPMRSEARCAPLLAMAGAALAIEIGEALGRTSEARGPQWPDVLAVRRDDPSFLRGLAEGLNAQHAPTFLIVVEPGANTLNSIAQERARSLLWREGHHVDIEATLPLAQLLVRSGEGDRGDERAWLRERSVAALIDFSRGTRGLHRAHLGASEEAKSSLRRRSPRL